MDGERETGISRASTNASSAEVSYRTPLRCASIGQAENDCECTVHSAQFIKAEQSSERPEAAGVNGAHLLNEDACPQALDLHLRSKGSRLSAR